MVNKLLTASFLSLLAVLGILLYTGHRASVQAQDILYVQTICDEAHSEINGTSEQACGNAQDETNTEYMCTTATNDGYCWVEVK